jgi:DNA-directed RNA polymerase specialized sigma24 family protein
MPGPSHEGRPASSVSEIAALARAFEAHRPRLLATVRRRIDPALAPRVDPEDILSEAFLRVRDKGSEHDPEEISVYAWLYRNVLECLIAAWRSGNAAGRSLKREIPWPLRSSVELGMGLVGSNTSPSEAFARKELRERIAWAVCKLDRHSG